MIGPALALKWCTPKQSEKGHLSAMSYLLSPELLSIQIFSLVWTKLVGSENINVGKR